MASADRRLSPRAIPPSARRILDTLHAAGHIAVLCGGAVRDLLMGRAPKDWDIATDATPNRVEELLSGIAHIVPVGRAFGVLVAVVGENTHEVATFRSEEGYADGRHPDRIAFSTPEADALRRDFTINALFYDPVRDRILDYVHGLEDLRNGLIRAVGDPRERFDEDHLRLLRTVRFAARTGFAVEPETWRATCALSPLATTVAAERIAAELESMLLGGHARKAFELLAESGLLAVVLPEVDRLRGVEQPPQFHPEGDVWVHTLIMLGLMDAARRGEWDRAVTSGPPADLAEETAGDPETGDAYADRTAPPAPVTGPLAEAERRDAVRTLYGELDHGQAAVLAWATLLHDVGKPQTLTFEDRIRFNNHDAVGAELAETILDRLRRPRALKESVRDLIGRHMHFAWLRRMRQSKLKRWLREPSFGLHLELHRLDCESSHRMLLNWAFGWERWREQLAAPPPAEPLMGGRDLIAMGLPPGPVVGEWLRKADDARLEGEFDTREAGLQWLRSRLREAGLIY